MSTGTDPSESPDPPEPAPWDSGPDREAATGLWDQEPLATVRRNPRRFTWGLPVVILVPMAVAFPFAEDSMARAVALQLFLQTAGLLWLYVPAYRRRYAEAMARLPDASRAPSSPAPRAEDSGGEEPPDKGSGSRG